MKTVSFASPWLIFLGQATDDLHAKTGHGLVDWRRENCLAQLRFPGCAADLGIPDMTPAEAAAAGAKSLVIGVAPVGGALRPEWTATLIDAMRAGLDLVSGMHSPLGNVPELAKVAQETGRNLVDIRKPPPGIPAANGEKRSGKRVLMVGTDCALGKKYTALALHREMQKRGMKATFRATGQTGIMISGGGMPMDAVVSDFLSGAAELLSPNNDADHWDVIEGQGSLFHPAYAAVTLGLVHGSQPDVMVLCHQVGRTTIIDYPDYPIPGLNECIRRYEEAAALTNRTSRVIGLSINTSELDEAGRKKVLAEVTRETGLPAVDPIATGVGTLIEAL
ncbi:MAG: DUF1611 domain-containing protein [Xanthomonadales bacterium]|nr:DUF1611 domain-containing protein [Xanthomonadales bacterium]